MSGITTFVFSVITSFFVLSFFNFLVQMSFNRGIWDIQIY